MDNTDRSVKVLVSILNWNGIDTTRACLNSLRSLQESGVTVVVSDNASRNDEAAHLQREYPDIEVLSNPENLGFAGGHNKVIELAIARGFDYIWILNNDCTVKEGDLAGLLAVAEADPAIGLVSPVIELPSADGKPVYQFCGAWHDWRALKSVRPLDIEQIRSQAQKTPMDMWVTGTAILGRCSVLKEIGGFDERYFAYYEDNELSVRASRHGYRCEMAYSVSMLHHSFANSFDRPPHYFYFCSRNELLFWSENTPEPYRARVKRRIVARVMLEARNLYDSGRRPQAEACVAGLIDAASGRLGPMRRSFSGGSWLGSIARTFPYRLGFALAGGPSPV